MYLQHLPFDYFGNMPQSGIIGLYGNVIFNFLINCHMIFQMALPFYIPTGSA